MRRVLFLFSQLNDADVEWLMQAGRKDQLAPEALVIREGQPVGFLSIILAGRVAVQREADSRVLAHLEAGDIVGEMSFIDQRPPSATVRAAEPSIILKLAHADFQRKLDRDTGFAARFYKAMSMMLSNRVREAQVASRPGGGTIEERGELDLGALDRVHLAGLKFQRLLQRLT